MSTFPSENDSTLRLPDGRSITLSELVDSFKSEHKVLVPVSGKVLPSPKSDATESKFSFRVDWSFNDYDIESSTTVTRYYYGHLNDSGIIEQVIEIPDQLGGSNELYALSSPSGRYSLYVKKSPKEPKANSCGQLIEIWRDGRHLQTIDVDMQQSHGELYLNSKLGSVAFSPSEHAVAFIAEQSVKSKSYFKDLSQVKTFDADSDRSDPNGKRAEAPGNAYELRQDWGEKFDDRFKSVVCVLQLEPEIKLIVHSYDDLCTGQVFWISDDHIGFLAFPELARKLGLTFCNRFSYLCQISWKHPVKSPSIVYGQDKRKHISYPRINHTRTQILFLESEACGPHAHATKLMLFNLANNQVQTLFDYHESDQSLPTLFILTLAANVWSADDSFVLFNTYSHSRNVICTFDIWRKRLTVLSHPLEDSTVLDFTNDFLITSGAAPNHPPTIFAAHIEQPSYDGPYHRVTNTKLVLENLHYSYVKFNAESKLEQVDCVVIGPQSQFDTPTPAIIFPHGGPHAMSWMTYSKTITFFVRLGFKVVLINYRGSLGYTNEYVYQLCGHVGDYDVKDVKMVVDRLIERNWIDAGNLSLYGGSHGGFLVTHLIGQYPDFGWRSCVALNPVTDMSKMFVITDIPDWCLVEAIGCDPADYKKLAANLSPGKATLFDTLNEAINVGSSELMRVMFEKSPIAHIDRVKTPVLMMLGRVDRRVPHSQGLAYVYALRQRNVPVKCHLYPDRHDIGKPPNSGDEMINSIKWILEHLSN